MKKGQVIKRVLKFPCYTCSTKGKIDGKKCKTCNGTGIYKENHYIHIVNGIAIDGDSLK
jgi:DnaJ-class molecular chaperone